MKEGKREEEKEGEGKKESEGRENPLLDRDLVMTYTCTVLYKLTVMLCSKERTFVSVNK